VARQALLWETSMGKIRNNGGHPHGGDTGVELKALCHGAPLPPTLVAGGG